MELIKEIESRRDKKGWLRKWAIFLCEHCKIYVEMRLDSGVKAKSCGCNKNIKHGDRKIRLYGVWTNIKTRCTNPNNKRYKDYGGRGITICPEWANDYIVFRDWSLSNGYQEGLQINRINNNGNYCPENCNFVTAKENSWNTRRIVLTLEIANEVRKLYATGDYTRKELGKKYGVNSSIISKIINNKIWRNI